MQWSSSFILSGLHNFNGFLANTTIGGKTRAKNALENIRSSILARLNSCGLHNNTVIHLRVTYANDLQDLWYMRGDIMADISAAQGEAVAKRHLADISEMFKGHLPRGLQTRPSPLGI